MGSVNKYVPFMSLKMVPFNCHDILGHCILHAPLTTERNYVGRKLV